jgi:hypothetical protein
MTTSFCNGCAGAHLSRSRKLSACHSYTVSQRARLELERTHLRTYALDRGRGRRFSLACRGNARNLHGGVGGQSR